MTQSLHIIFQDGTSHWGPVNFRGKVVQNSKELLEILIENKPQSLLTLSNSHWNYTLSQIDKFKDIPL